MKKSELNLDVLENAGNRALKKLSDEYVAVSEKEISRLFDKSEELYRRRKTESSDIQPIIVSGVDKYHRPVLKTVFTAVSVFVLIAGSVAGGALLLKTLRNQSDDIPADDMQSVTEEITEIIAPFGDITGSRMRFTSPAYIPYLYDAPKETTYILAEALGSSDWEEIPGSTPIPDGESVLVYIKNGDTSFKLEFLPDNTVKCEANGRSVRYKISEEASTTAYSSANPPDFEVTKGHLIWSKFEDITADGVWKNNEPVPEKIFVAPELPEKLNGKYIINNEPLYEYAWNFEDFTLDAEHAKNFIIGKVNDISFESRDGVAYTQISITVSEDITGKVPVGENIVTELVGGYVSMREKIEQPSISEHTSDEYTLKDYDVDNTYYHEIVGSGKLPIIGNEYGFLVDVYGNDRYGVIGQEYGILYKCDNIYIQQNSQGFSFYDIDDIKLIMKNTLSADTLPYYDKPESDEKIVESPHADNNELAVFLN